MLHKNLPPQKLAALNAELKQYGINEQQIIGVINSLQIIGDNNIVFQDSNHNVVNITLPLNDDAMLTRLAKRISQALQPQQIAHYIGDIWHNDAAFFGRAIEKEGIIQDLKRHKKVLLQGMGGMGKTTLAYNICQEIGDQYDHVIWTNCQNANPDAPEPLRDHLLYKSTQLHKNLNLSDVLQAEQDATQKWEILMDKIGKLGKSVLWIIDNAYKKDAATIKQLPHNCKIILTSREPISNIPEHKIDELDIINALQLFKHYYKRPDNDNKIMEVCNCVANHALTIELLAKTLQELPNKDTSFLLDELNDKGININRQQEISTNYIPKETYLNECLLIAFNLGKLSTQTAIHPLLRFFCLMPYQYIAYNLIQQITQTQDNAAQDLLLNHLKQLTNLGWLKQSQTEWDDTIQDGWQMHPVIQDMINQQLGKDIEQEEAICGQIHNKSWAAYEQNAIAAQLWRPFLERLVKCIVAQDETIVNIYNVLSLINQAMGNYAIALQQQKIALQIAEQILSPQHPNLAALYMNIGTTYDDLIDYATALNYYKKCRTIYEQILSPQHHNLATLYLNMGAAYGSLTDYTTALDYYEKSCTIYEQILPQLHPNLATLYLNMGNTYLGLTDYTIALNYYEKCRAIREQILPPQHPDLATLYLNMAVTYDCLTYYATALDYYEKCRTIREQILPPLHPDLASLYLNMGNTYNDLTNYATALKYHEKCRTIREQILPPLHPDLASLYLNMGNTYNDLTNYATALDYYEKCRTIYEQILPQLHPNLATLYLNIGNTYNALTNYATALNYYEKCRTIYEQILPPQHPNLAILYKNMSVSYFLQAQFQKAKAYIDKAVSISKVILPIDHPHFQKALQIQRNISNPFVALLKKLWHVLLGKIGFGNKK